jgi:predicted peptidase
MVWDRDNRDVFAINVTDRYLKKDSVIPPGFVRMRFKTLGPSGPDRCQANVIIRDQDGNVVFRGLSKDERFDANDHLTTALASGRKYLVEVRHANAVTTAEFTASEDGKVVIIKASEPSTAINQLGEYLKLPRESRKPIADQAFAATNLSAEEAKMAAAMLVDDHLAYVRATRSGELKDKVIKADEAEMPFEYKVFGEKPAAGHCLVISMHGGGGAPKRVNDGQWENQKKLYELEEGIYVAPRGPTDTWNLWHQSHIDSLFTRLIEDFIAIESIDPNRVYISGYSAGGDGVFQLAPRMADQLAAAAMMAGHPNETKPLGLRNLPFTMHVGGKDAAYNRNTIAQNWADELSKLHAADPKGYEHWAKIYPEKGHWMDREEREGVKWMLKYRRNLTPEKVVWLQDDVIHSRFYWLGCDPIQSKQGDTTIVLRNGNEIVIEQAPTGVLQFLLRDDMLNLDNDIVIRKGESELWRGKAGRTIAILSQTLADRGDPQAVFSAKIDVNVTN